MPPQPLSTPPAAQFSPCGKQYAVLTGSSITLHAVDGEPGASAQIRGGGGVECARAHTRARWRRDRHTAAAGALHQLVHPRRTLCMAWHPTEHRLVSGSEDGSLRIWDTAVSQREGGGGGGREGGRGGAGWSARRAPSDAHGTLVSQSGGELACLPRAHAARVRALAVARVPGSSGEPLVASAASDGVVQAWRLAQDPPSLHPLGQAQTGARLTCLAWCGGAAARDSKRKRQQEDDPRQQNEGGGGKVSRGARARVM